MVRFTWPRLIRNSFLSIALLALVVPTQVSATDTVLRETDESAVQTDQDQPATDDVEPEVADVLPVDEEAVDIQPLDEENLQTLGMPDETSSSQDDTTDDVENTTQIYQNAEVLQISKIQVRSADDAYYEAIELYNPSSEALHLEGWEVDYFTGGYDFGVGTLTPTKQLKVFSADETISAQGTIILASSSAIESLASIGVAPIDFGRGTLSNDNGSVRLIHDGQTVDMVGWGKTNQEELTITSIGSAVWQRCMTADGVLADSGSGLDFAVYADVSYGAFAQCADPNDDDGTTDEQASNACDYVHISEIGANLNAQYIEIHNNSDAAISLAGCRLQTNRNTKEYVFAADAVLAADAYLSIDIDTTELTLTKTTTGIVYLINTSDDEVDSVTYENLSKDTSWALLSGEWLQTYVLTPSAANSYMQYPPCDAGYYRNTETGRCNKIVVESELTPCAADEYRSTETNRCRKIATATSTLTPCAEGQYRNPLTNRCKSLASATTLVPCEDGYYRNPETNRCKKIAAAASTLTPCKEGYERNPETNRCRKVAVTAATMPLADFPVEAVTAGSKVFVAWWAIGGVLFAGLGYAAWEWRHELRRMIQSVGMHRARKQ